MITNYRKWKYTCLTLVLLVPGCATLHYSQIQQGKLTGKLLVEWIDADLFIFTPDKEKPLRFGRHNGEIIEPGRMITDGGSIARVFWALRSYSPWGYAPAFITHDWLFAVKHCGYSVDKNYTFDESAIILSEIIKTLMLDPKYNFEDKLSMYAIHEAVTSPIAREIWDNGKCSNESDLRSIPRKAALSYMIEFP